MMRTVSFIPKINVLSCVDDTLESLHTRMRSHCVVNVIKSKSVPFKLKWS